VNSAHDPIDQFHRANGRVTLDIPENPAASMIASYGKAMEPPRRRCGFTLTSANIRERHFCGENLDQFRSGRLMGRPQGEPFMRYGFRGLGLDCVAHLMISSDLLI
jgi:hypothetical protein